ncbi:MAG: methyltransferase domain-containing protein [Patescibacteria group bacterium]|nr:methyltransferase domain-containing protein [Patescibacteria group bacterium]
MNKQVDKEHYNFSSYVTLDRWSSYWYQIKEILALQPAEVLEIGVGDKVLASYLKNNTTINYKNVDIAEDLSPDILGDVRKLPLADNSFDLVCAFEVLEHLPFEDFDQAIAELKRVSKKYILLSLPHWGRHFSFKIFLPKIGYKKWQYKFDKKPIAHQFRGEHYWEIGKKNYPLKRIKKHIQKAGLELVKDNIAFESPYHHFFILKKK